MGNDHDSYCQHKAHYHQDGPQGICCGPACVASKQSARRQDPTATTLSQPASDAASAQSQQQQQQGIIVWFVRHGEAEHNNNRPHIRDPALTQLGVSQAEATRAQLSRLGIAPGLIVASPLRRTVQTASIVFKGQKVVLHSGLQEVSTQHCDTGREMQELQRDLDPQVWALIDHTSTDTIKPKWYVKPKRGTDLTVLARERLAGALEWIEAECGRLGVREAVVVGHAGALGLILYKQLDYATPVRYILHNGRLTPATTATTT